MASQTLPAPYCRNRRPAIDCTEPPVTATGDTLTGVCEPTDNLVERIGRVPDDTDHRRVVTPVTVLLEHLEWSIIVNDRWRKLTATVRTVRDARVRSSHGLGVRLVSKHAPGDTRRISSSPNVIRVTDSRIEHVVGELEHSHQRPRDPGFA